MSPNRPITLRPVESSLFLLDARTRLPFRFGVHTLTVAPLCLLRLTAELSDGSKATGFASDLLVPKWFEKNPAAPVSKDWSDLIASAQDAGNLALANPKYETPFEHWHRLYQTQVGLLAADDPTRLVRNHGVTLVERAMIDAVCRARACSLHEALNSDRLGFRPADLDPSLGAWSPAAHLPAAPIDRVTLRHTVGLLDALDENDTLPSESPNDGLPLTLAQDIEAHGLTQFKLKVVGDDRLITDRLTRISAVVRPRVGDGARFTLDGNEQCETMADLARSLEHARTDEHAAWLLDRVMWIEQPLARHRSFDAAACAGMEDLTRVAPCIIDEADDSIDTLIRAQRNGYRGISVKNCKGVFRALLNTARCAVSGGTLFQTAEDLTNLPVIALQQDLETAATLGLCSVERNGHHYFNGLRHLPQQTADDAIACHPDLYDPATTSLRIENGTLSTASIITAAGYGYDGPVSLEGWTPANEWTPDALLNP